MRWTPPATFSSAEDQVCEHLTKAGRFYLFVRSIRERLFDDATHPQWVGRYTGAPHGTSPKTPAWVAMVRRLQAYATVADEAAIRRVHLDPAWRWIVHPTPSDRRHPAKVQVFR